MDPLNLLALPKGLSPEPAGQVAPDAQASPQTGQEPAFADVLQRLNPRSTDDAQTQPVSPELTEEQAAHVPQQPTGTISEVQHLLLMAEQIPGGLPQQQATGSTTLSNLAPETADPELLLSPGNRTPGLTSRGGQVQQGSSGNRLQAQTVLQGHAAQEQPVAEPGATRPLTMLLQGNLSSPPAGETRPSQHLEAAGPLPTLVRQGLVAQASNREAAVSPQQQTPGTSPGGPPTGTVLQPPGSPSHNLGSSNMGAEDGATTQGDARQQGYRQTDGAQATFLKTILSETQQGPRAGGRLAQTALQSASSLGEGLVAAGSMIGNQGPPISVPTTSPVGAVAPTPIELLHNTSVPQVIQSVHLEIHPADLGRIQLRVMLANQTVHTQVTTQHADVGQFLIARQGQLETALNTSGLDLGQFRVLVDRHGSGQGSQEWTPQPHDHGQGQDRQDARQFHQPEELWSWSGMGDHGRRLHLIV